jgi:hypothetical protein
MEKAAGGCRRNFERCLGVCRLEQEGAGVGWLVCQPIRLLHPWPQEAAQGVGEGREG